MGSLFPQKPAVSLDMVRHLLGLVRKVAAKFGGFAGSPATASDSTCDRIAGLDNIPPLSRGIVVRSGIGSYDCEVQLNGRGGGTLVCSVLASALSPIYGVSEVAVPAPGSAVLVYAPAQGLLRTAPVKGVILGVLPEYAPHGVSPADGSAGAKFADTEFPEGGVAQFTESGPAAVASDKDYPYRGDFQCGRPHDMVPGEYALLNHAGSGVVIGALSATVKGSEMASVRCSALDDQVRVTSGHFKHINAAGSNEIYNDGGYVTVESFVSLYHHERLGLNKPQSEAFRWTAAGTAAAFGEKRSGVSPLKPTQTAKKRFYRYAGYLGDIVNVFVASPDSDKDVEEMANPGKDAGLLHYHVDSSGRFTLRSAGGVLFERYDRIPVPKRMHYAWDPSGDKAGGSPKAKTPFSLDAKHPMASGLALADMAAWWNSQAYTRFVQFGKDFRVQKQSELSCPADEYDKYGSGTENFQEYDLRHSYMGLLPNGSIVLRDAWGSEIVMADGRITFNAAANIEIRSGSSVVILGGDDVVAKAYNSVDLSATKKDVRIKAENNLQVVSMKRGVLIQSKAEGDADPSAWEKAGEDLQSAGVVLKADKSSVVVAGRRTAVQGEEGVSVAAFKGEEPSGAVVISGKQVSATAADSVIATAKGTSGLVLSADSAMLCAPTVFTVGAQSATDVAGNKLMLGIPLDAESLYASVVSICKNHSQLYLDSVEWLRPVPPTAFSSVDFRFRTTKQYGTDKDSGLAGGVFSVYEPSWAAMAEAQRTLLKGVRTRGWDEGEDAAGEQPWPGADAAKANSYRTYKEQNLDGRGVEEAKSGTAHLTDQAFSQYHIRRSE